MILIRQSRWLQARNGNVGYLRKTVDSLRTVRANMDQIFDTRIVSLIYIGSPRWFADPMLKGAFADGTPIVDPDTFVPIGTWAAHGHVQRLDVRHLDHMHIELKQRGNANR